MAWLSKKQLEQNSVEAAQAAMALADLQEQVSAVVEALRHVIGAVHSLHDRVTAVEVGVAAAQTGVDVVTELLDEGLGSESSGE